ncbi:MAG: UDP-N-acetylmuramoyl-L-alanine--D-glutamate ligase [Deltaproteobacteria bacterium]|nr:UDP-N-acetylmuramoyl-L-alanine--D-glutamate ligase [Deltaproteobacteria bacterium]
MELTGKRVLVVGLGRSGTAAARLCARRGARVTVTDQRSEGALSDAVAALGGCATLELGGHREASFTGAELIVLSPGVPPIPELEAARRAGVPVIGEIELAYRFVRGRVVAITGTNGKSTTTSLLGAMAEASGAPTFCGGNLGQPFCEAVDTPAAGPDGLLVLELSSFQLETVETFHARVALLLNLTEDHLDRYATFAEYQAAKARIFERQTATDFAVVNGAPDQELCRTLARASRAQLLTFRLDDGREPGAWPEEDALCVRLPRGEVERYPRSLLALAGQHNLQNALAALLGARLAGVPADACTRALETFRGLPHRMQLVGETRGVRYYNDSKATNVGSVIGSLTGFERPVVLIAGGKDKGGDYAPLVPVLAEVCRHAVLIGAAAPLIERTLAGHLPLHHAGTLPEAVRLAASLARTGDAVILSPACSSYDMFTNYEERGRVFASAVAALPD